MLSVICHLSSDNKGTWWQRGKLFYWRSSVLSSSHSLWLTIHDKHLRWRIWKYRH